MAETADEIRAGIEETRADLDHKLGMLEAKARHELSLRNQFARRPWQALGAAAGLGLVLGLMFGGRREHDDDEWEEEYPRHRRSWTRLRAYRTPPTGRHGHTVLDTTGVSVADPSGRKTTTYPDLPL